MKTVSGIFIDGVDAAHRALKRGIPPHVHRTVLHRVTALIDERAEQFAEAIRIEADKPISAARNEAARAAQTFRFAAEAAGQVTGETVALDAVPNGEGATAFTLPEPIGIVAAITPFNFPLNLSAHKIGPAIAAGCPVLFKPAARCPLTARLIVQAFVDAGLPEGLLNLVCGPAAEVVDEWQSDDRVEVINFIGSPAVGWALKAASPRKHHILELGSASATVVHSDADLDRAAADAAVAGYASSGQICISLQRVFVHTSVADEFLSRLADHVRRIPFGDPREPETVVAPLITMGDAERLENWVASAIGDRRGCRATRRRPEAGWIASAHPSGGHPARRRDHGAGSIRPMPYGGVKDSGQGVEGMRYAVDELTRKKLVAFAA